MNNTILVALSQHTALRLQMAVIANNIANSNTAGFKSERVTFATHLKDMGGGQKLAFVKESGIVRDPSDGPLMVTGNPFDLAIRGDAFFRVDTPQGERLTRGGQFRLDADGALVTANGYPVLGKNGLPLLIAPGDATITIARDGRVASESGEIGRLGLVTFDSGDELTKLGGGLYASDAEPIPSDDAEVVQGAIEASNVQPIVEMTRMIALLRSYQSAQSLAEKEDELKRRAIGTLASVSQSA